TTADPDALLTLQGSATIAELTQLGIATSGLPRGSRNRLALAAGCIAGIAALSTLVWIFIQPLSKAIAHRIPLEVERSAVGGVEQRLSSSYCESDAAIDALATGDGDALPRIEVHRHWNRPAKPATDPVRRLAGAARATAEDLGDTLPFSSTGGVCDGNILQANGLPTLDTLGVRGGNLHRTDEFVEVASLVQRCSLLAVLLLRISTGQGQ
ncbi:MAG: M20/M25/M40 family metallo-hydrolase, partial [Planctomycetes bacterium]|nr:M20/M25/M40 family metallo-hydrolase [Planctomycetota bacterium]